MPRPTLSIDNWRCPWCREYHRFESARAGAEAVGDLSGFYDELDCPSCGKKSTVSLSIEFRAEPVQD